MISSARQSLAEFWRRFGRLVLALRLPLEPFPHQQVCSRPQPATPAQLARRNVGTPVFGGMILAAFIGIFAIPPLYVMFQALRERFKPAARSEKTSKPDKFIESKSTPAE